MNRLHFEENCSAPRLRRPWFQRGAVSISPAGGGGGGAGGVGWGGQNPDLTKFVNFNNFTNVTSFSTVSSPVGVTGVGNIIYPTDPTNESGLKKISGLRPDTSRPAGIRVVTPH